MIPSIKANTHVKLKDCAVLSFLYQGDTKVILLIHSLSGMVDAEFGLLRVVSSPLGQLNLLSHLKGLNLFSGLGGLVFL